MVHDEPVSTPPDSDSSPAAARTPWRSVPERKALGQAARETLPREQHAHCPQPEIDVVGLLRAEDVDRIPELLPIRYERMLATPFTYYRGSAVVMAADLASQPHSGLMTQLCGDAHLSNFGIFATPERRLIFDVNDFDETLPGPFEWDVKRLAASIVLAARDNGFTRAQGQDATHEAMATYRTTMREFAAQGNLKVWYSSLDVEQGMVDLAPLLTNRARKFTAKAVERARGRDSVQAASKLTELVDGRHQFLSDPPLMVPLRELLPSADADLVQAALREVLADYRASLHEDRRALFDQFHLTDVARKVVGVGSVGTRTWVVLLTGRGSDDPLLLQVKEAGPSVLEQHLGASAHATSCERVIAGQRLMQASSDVFLGRSSVPLPDGTVRHRYLRQLRDGKGSADLSAMNAKGLALYARMCGWTLARAHARSGDRVAIAAYLGKRGIFESAMVAFAEEYADRVQKQYRALQAAGERGELPRAEATEQSP